LGSGLRHGEFKNRSRFPGAVQKTLADNTTRVEIGTMAQIDVIQSKSDVANKKDALVTTTFAVTSAEDQIKKLVSADKTPSLFLMKFTPKDMPQPAGAVQIPTLEEAVKIALENRPELKNALRDLQNKDLGVDYYVIRRSPCWTSSARSLKTALVAPNRAPQPLLPSPVDCGSVLINFSISGSRGTRSVLTSPCL